jgi:Homeodomain-like domain-containing protein
MKDIIRVRPLRPYEKSKLRRLKRQRRNAVNSRNARMILLAVGGCPNRAIADMVGCSAQWVRQILHRFNDDGIDGITWYPWCVAPAYSLPRSVNTSPKLLSLRPSR